MKKIMILAFMFLLVCSCDQKAGRKKSRKRAKPRPAKTQTTFKKPATSKPANNKPKIAGGGKWRYPGGKPKQLAQMYSVAELTEALRTMPDSSTLFFQHGIYARALGEKGVKAASAVPDLAKLAYHKDGNLRRAAMQGLVGIGKAGIPAMIKALEAKNVDVRWDAAAVLAKSGPVAAPAVPSLAKRILDKKEMPYVKEECAAALVKIGKPARKAVANILKHYKKNPPNINERSVVKTLKKK